MELVNHNATQSRNPNPKAAFAELQRIKSPSEPNRSQKQTFHHVTTAHSIVSGGYDWTRKPFRI